MPRLQVRQLQITTLVEGVPETQFHRIVQGSWLDVESPMWLIGFILPHPGLAYEFRNAPEDE
jgi:hypothetical protein